MSKSLTESIIEGGNIAARVVNIITNKSENKKKLINMKDGSGIDIQVSTRPVDVSNKKPAIFAIFDKHLNKNRGDIMINPTNDKSDLVQIVPDPINRIIKIIDRTCNGRTSEYSYENVDGMVDEVAKIIGMENPAHVGRKSLASVIEEQLKRK